MGNLRKLHKPLAKSTPIEVQQTQAEGNNGRVLLIGTMLGASATPAAGAAPRGAARTASSAGAAPTRRKSWKTPPLGVTFDGDHQQLLLEGVAAHWMLTLNNENALELRNFNRFMVALCQ